MTLSLNNKRIRMALVLLVFVGLIFSLIPEKTEAQWPVFDIPTEVGTGATAISGATTAIMTTADKIKNWVIDPAARMILKLIIKKLTAQTVNWINSGFQGNPGFVSDPKQFFLGIANQTASQFLSDTNLNNILCTPFQAQVRVALVKNYLQTAQDTGGSFASSCSLTTMKNNYGAFMNDFSQGGWEGWFQITQTSNGNPYSAYFSAKNSLNAQLASQQNRYQTQLTQGNGFLSYQKCKQGTTYAEKAQAQQNAATTISVCMYPDGTQQEGVPETDCHNAGGDIELINSGNAAATTYGPTLAQAQPDNCDPADKIDVTPGSVINSQLQHALGTDLSQLELAKSVDEIASALITQLFNRVMGSTGLLQNTSSASGGPIAEVTLPNPDKPFITLLSKSPMTILRAKDQNGNVTSASFSDPGAMAYDYTDGDISNKITTTGYVNTYSLGTYTITYNVTNSKGIPADPATLTVIIADVTTTNGGNVSTCHTCAEKGQSDNYLQDVKNAIVVSSIFNSDINSSMSDIATVARFTNKIISTLQNNGFNAEVASNQSQTVNINVWKSGDLDKTTYTILSGTGTISDAAQNPTCDGHATLANVDIIPNSCLSTNSNTGTTPGTGSNTGTTPAVPVITSVSPVGQVQAGITTITITGTDLTDQVSFQGSNGMNTVETGTVNSTQTETVITIPDYLPAGNTIVEVQGNQGWSNPVSINIRTTMGTQIP